MAVNKLYFKRYGKFNYRDYLSAWVAMLFLWLLSFSLIYIGEFSFGIIIISLTLLWILSIFIPYFEFFYIESGKIYVHKGLSKHNFEITNKTLIISYTDIHFPLEIQSYILKNKYSVSIVQQDDIALVSNMLHKNHVKKYTNNTIENNFGNCFNYSFVCNQQILNQLLENNVKVIIPESLIGVFNFDNIKQCKVYFDLGY